MRKTKAQLWADLERDGEQFRRDNPQLGLTKEQAIDKVLTSKRYREYQEAEDGPSAAKAGAQGSDSSTKSELVEVEYKNGVRRKVLPAVANRVIAAGARAVED